jgi:hydrogenase maturation protein HypF
MSCANWSNVRSDAEPLRAVAGGRRRVRARVEGTVQGVGFRPFVHRLAAGLALAGWVCNDERGVLLEVEGTPDAVDALIVRLATDAPPLATVERVATEELPATGVPGFAIVESERHGAPAALVSPDTATCDDCLRELFDPADRRHRYPFINCTNCGPRFTIVRGVPYDRPLTTMAGFRMCPSCQAEYDDPGDRRFHAQPNACPACGPRLQLLDEDGAALAGDPLTETAAALRAGRVIAIKGIGGYHLACAADDEDAVAALRARKHREDKPFALMAPGPHAASRLVRLREPDAALLAARERPIVLAPRRPGAPVAAAVAPRSPDLGVMLPYSPLHHLLLADMGAPLVMTSANRSDEPIAYRDEDALERLAGIADLFLVHDRPIETRTDDSVARVAGDRTLLVRRSRGYVPASIPLPIHARRPLLACGAELKSTFCLARGGRAWVGHHVGDLRNYETLRSYTTGIEHFERLFAIAPQVVAHDLHPDYHSTRYAIERTGVTHVAVQHHHAHLAAVLAEHGEAGPAVGAIYDGAGLGTDGTIWGGELLVGDLEGYERAGHLRAARLPGGDRAVEEPWRMACAWLVEATGPEPAIPRALTGAVDAGTWRAVAGLAASGFSAPVTTSAGRLFDGIAALCGIRARIRYEGQAAVELEASCDPGERGAYEISCEGDPIVLDPRAAIRAVARDVDAGAPAGTVAARFHNGLADATARACVVLAERNGLDVAVLSGGVFQNRVLLERTIELLERAGLRVLVPVRLPPGDGGISYGQAAVAAALG